MRISKILVVCLTLFPIARTSDAAAHHEDPADHGAACFADEDTPFGAASWPSAGHDLSHTGHNPAETTLTPRTVGRLRVVWQHRFAPFAGVPIPVVGTAVTADDTAYFADAAGLVHARNLATGAHRWLSFVSHATPDPAFQARFQSAPTLTADALFVGDSSGKLFKLDRRTGHVRWSRDLDAHPYAVIQGDPIAFAGRVIVPVAGYENYGANIPENGTLRGSVVALDQATGRMLWQRYTTSDQRQRNPRFGAGAGVWSSPAIDPTTERIFVGTGQFYEPGSSQPDPGSAREADYSDSLLSISLRTGRILDAVQFTQGDVWGTRYPDGLDFDVGIPPTLFAMAQRGRAARALVGVGDKKGLYYVLDRRTLDEVWRVEIAQGSVVGGIQSTAAYADGVLYVAGHEAIDGTSLQDRIPPGQSATFLTTPEGILLTQRGARTNLYALDAATGRILWQTHTPGAITLCPLVVGGGVLYQADINGTLRAFDARTGELLTQRQVGGTLDGEGNTVSGNLNTALSLSRGRLLLSTIGLVDGAPSGVVAFGL